VPARTPRAVVERLNAATNATLADPAVRGRIEAVRARPRGGSAEDFAAFIRAENAKWAEVIRRAGAQAE
jgi:tripartite-type tricarboxylate transporter receptor subunit TctC